MCFFITFHTRTLGFVHNGLLLLTPMPSSLADALFFPIQAPFAFTYRYRNLDSVHERKQACFPHYPRLFPSYPLLLSLFHLSISISILWVKKNMKYFSFCICIIFLCVCLFVLIYFETYLGCLGTHSIHEPGLELTEICLLLPPQCLD